MTDGIAALQEALAAEHVALYAYGLVGPHLAGAPRADADAAAAAHRGRRDALTNQLAAATVTPTPAAPAYTPPFPVADQASALRLAVLVEERTGQAWRAAVAATTGEQRRSAVAALTDTAVRAARWRRYATPAGPITVAFPGS
jgi:hypothetical protein